jgi:hypothetical protein
VEARFCRLESLEDGDLTEVLFLELAGWDVAAGAVQPAVVEPAHPFQGRQLCVIEPAPGPAAMNQLGLEQADERFGGGVVVGVGGAADGGYRAGVGEALGVPHSEVLPGLNRSWQHRLVGASVGAGRQIRPVSSS